MTTKKQKDCTHLVARLPSTYNPLKPSYQCVKCGQCHNAHSIAKFLWSRYIGDKLMDTTFGTDKREEVEQ